MEHSQGFLQLVREVKTRIKEISATEARILSTQSGAHLVDVREESEWEAGHAAGAIHLGKGVIERDVENRIPDRNAKVMLYCGGGYRSALAADNLQRMGYKDVLSVDGGYRAWTEANLPTTTRPEVVPRSPYEKLGGIIHLPRLIDKARLFPQGKLPGYNYLTVGSDKSLLEFLCLEPVTFEKAVRESPDDASVLKWLKNHLGPSWPSDHAILEFSDKLARKRPDTSDKQARFDQMRAGMPSAKKKIETYFDLIDLEEGRIS